jgi:hypothetical protein
VLFVHEVFLRFLVLFFSLPEDIVLELLSSLSFFFSLLLFSDRQLFISEFPELREFLLFQLFLLFFSLHSHKLIFPGSLDCLLLL